MDKTPMLALVSLLLTSSVQAAIITPGVWSPVAGGTVKPYWAGAPGLRDWLHGPDTQVEFLHDGRGGPTVWRVARSRDFEIFVLETEQTPLAAQNRLWWVGGLHGTQSGTIFEPGARGGAARAFAPTPQYALGFTTPLPSLHAPWSHYRTDDPGSTGQFALVRLVVPGLGVWYQVGINDHPVGLGPRGYDDLIAVWDPPFTPPGDPVPEPATLALLGAGLLGIGWRAAKGRRS